MPRGLCVKCTHSLRLYCQARQCLAEICRETKTAQHDLRHSLGKTETCHSLSAFVSLSFCHWLLSTETRVKICLLLLGITVHSCYLVFIFFFFTKDGENRLINTCSCLIYNIRRLPWIIAQPTIHLQQKRYKIHPSNNYVITAKLVDKVYNGGKKTYEILALIIMSL
jgi:hypothetical protein